MEKKDRLNIFAWIFAAVGFICYLDNNFYWIIFGIAAVVCGLLAFAIEKGYIK